jgi:hypothetical protein
MSYIGDLIPKHSKRLSDKFDIGNGSSQDPYRVGKRFYGSHPFQ